MSAVAPTAAVCAAAGVLIVHARVRAASDLTSIRGRVVDQVRREPRANRSRGRSAAGAALVGSLLVAGAALAVGGVAVVALVATAVLGSRATGPRRLERRRQRAIARALPDSLDLLAVSLEAGHLPIDAIRLLHPALGPELADAFGEVLARHDRGERTSSALAALPERLGTASLGLVDVLVQTDRAGLAFGPAVERLADEARAHRRRLAEAAARELPVRLSFPLVICTLPAFVLVAIVPLLVGALSSIRVG